MNNRRLLGHILAFSTIAVWGFTFIATKLLLRVFAPVEIFMIRFVIAYILLWVIYPKPLKLEKIKDEVPFAMAGLCGITLYYLLENVSLAYTRASNVSIIVSTAPFFIAIIYYVLGNKSEMPDWKFYLGFVFAIVGIALLSFTTEGFVFSFKGDGLALISAIAWGFYSYYVKKCSDRGYNVFQITRRCFMYGILFTLPILPFTSFSLSPEKFSDPVMLFCLLFLGVLASAICFVTWNYGVKLLGAVASGVYIYLNPVFTVIAAYFTLGERFTFQSILGMLLVMSGLILSEL
ncbi:MAG: DMT family transporter [Sphaerochaetaceae bacterium]|nr:DMT family transporter [Sphaerochaetaceae bacterium]